MRKSFLIPILLILFLSLSFCFTQTDYAFCEENYLYLGGIAVGISLDCDEVYITSKINVITKNGIENPFADVDILAGDVIYSINDNIVKTPNDIENIIKDKQYVQVKIKRKDKYLNFKIKPALDLISKTNKLGLLLQDRISGIGTITYINSKDNSYAALGHPIKDYQNNIILGAKGNIFLAKIDNVVKPNSGKPGQLNGIFDKTIGVIGSILTSTDTGIYGQLYTNSFNKYKVLVGKAKIGYAKIFTTVFGDTPKFYDIKITKINNNGIGDLEIQIIDNDLKKLSGGIVQGMSGSPIIQDGKIIGAVTHVFVNDPTRGYGIFIEKMFEN